MGYQANAAERIAEKIAVLHETSIECMNIHWSLAVAQPGEVQAAPCSNLN